MVPHSNDGVCCPLLLHSCLCPLLLQFPLAPIFRILTFGTSTSTSCVVASLRIGTLNLRQPNNPSTNQPSDSSINHAPVLFCFGLPTFAWSSTGGGAGASHPSGIVLYTLACVTTMSASAPSAKKKRWGKTLLKFQFDIKRA